MNKTRKAINKMIKAYGAEKTAELIKSSSGKMFDTRQHYPNAVTVYVQDCTDDDSVITVGKN